jgi:hypothetical protein
MQSDSRTLLTSQASSSSPSSAQGKPDRLYVGNLSSTVDEYTLIQVFQKYGKITKLDFMFHKTGVLKGKPRGYAFVEFSNKDVSETIEWWCTTTPNIRDTDFPTGCAKGHGQTSRQTFARSKARGYQCQFGMLPMFLSSHSNESDARLPLMTHRRPQIKVVAQTPPKPPPCRYSSNLASPKGQAGSSVYHC